MPNRLHASGPAPGRLRREVLAGLRRPQKELPPKLFYDAAGSRLFERICELDEYYLPRSELAIMRRHAAEMAEALGPRLLLVEYGSGNSAKTRILLDHLRSPAAYVPIDIARAQLQRAAAELAAGYPELEVLPIWADFTSRVTLPSPKRQPVRTAVYMPGSTIGNFHPPQVSALLRRFARLSGPQGGQLIGIDLKKDPRRLHRAYNDRAGVTRDFNLNVLVRLNREFGADFRLDAFEHRAFYDPAHGRIEMHLASLRRQTVTLGIARFDFREGETIRTECSYKYEMDQFAQLAAAAGLAVKQSWLDDERFFAVLYLVSA